MSIPRVSALVVLICGGIGLVVSCFVAGKAHGPSSTAVRMPAANNGPLVVPSRDVEIRCGTPTDGDAASTNKTTMLVRNDGESPVTITSLIPDCTCADAEIQPTIIPPGEVARVLVQVKPFRRGGRDVAIRLNTDSAAQPVAVLRVRVLGSDAPPYLLAANGDLHFSDNGVADDLRLLTVKTVVPQGEQAREPSIRSDLRGLKWTLERTEARPTFEAGATTYLYRYHVRMSGPSAGPMRGYVHVGDPWDADSVESLPCAVDVPPALRVAPTHLLLTASKAMPEGAHGALLVMTKGDPTRVTVNCDRPKESPLRVRRLASSDGSTTVATFDITVSQEFAPSQGSWRLLVKDESLDQAAIEVPVRLVLKD